MLSRRASFLFWFSLRPSVRPSEFSLLNAAVRFPFLQAAAEGLVVDSAIVKGQGAVADVLVTWGKLKPKDIVVAGTEYGKVRG